MQTCAIRLCVRASGHTTASIPLSSYAVMLSCQANASARWLAGIRLNGCRLDAAIRIRVLEVLKSLNDALDQSAASHFPAATDNLREAADGAVRAVARLTPELRTH